MLVQNVFRFICFKSRKNAITPPIWHGLKFFNVYGANEYRKEAQSSVHPFLTQLKLFGKIKLFKSLNKDYLDGEQRDFVSVNFCIQFMKNIQKLS